MAKRQSKSFSTSSNHSNLESQLATFFSFHWDSFHCKELFVTQDILLSLTLNNSTMIPTICSERVWEERFNEQSMCWSQSAYVLARAIKVKVAASSCVIMLKRPPQLPPNKLHAIWKKRCFTDSTPQLHLHLYIVVCGRCLWAAVVLNTFNI